MPFSWVLTAWGWTRRLLRASLLSRIRDINAPFWLLFAVLNEGTYQLLTCGGGVVYDCHLLHDLGHVRGLGHMCLIKNIENDLY